MVNSKSFILRFYKLHSRYSKLYQVFEQLVRNRFLDNPYHQIGTYDIFYLKKKFIIYPYSNLYEESNSHPHKIMDRLRERDPTGPNGPWME